MAARASYIAGFAGTATMLAEKRFGIPTFGTMAHSFIQAHDDEPPRSKVRPSRPDNLTLLIDTYDTEAARAEGRRAGSAAQGARHHDARRALGQRRSVALSKSVRAYPG